MATGPCEWPLDVTCYPAWDTTDVILQNAATAWATAVLWGLTGRQFDSCPVTVRPCGRCVGQTYRTYGVWTDIGVYGAGVGPTWIPYIDIDGAWRNCGCAGACSCEPSSQAWLGAGPISAIASVRVDDVVVPPEEYRLDVHKGGYWLVGQLGRVWPECQNFDAAATSSDNTFVVSVIRGTPVPAAGEVMAGILAAEFVKYCTGGECTLSPNATSVSRDGVSFEIASAATVIADGYTGHPIVDAWVYSVNPKKKTTRPRVWSPDMDFPRQTVA
jgi:hypothetical protein